MTSTMLRICLTAAVALAAVAAKGGPEKSVFAGTYVGSGGGAPITISDNGQIRSSSDDGATKFSLSGRVYADGTYEYTVDVTEPNLEHGPRDKRVWLRYSYESTGTLALDGDGNIVGTPSTGGLFTWVRQ
jgi:isoaspartyl peptidase/L-asparaginase-like protein (Ntn-hydrolase superfamily)